MGKFTGEMGPESGEGCVHLKWGSCYPVKFAQNVPACVTTDRREVSSNCPPPPPPTFLFICVLYSQTLNDMCMDSIKTNYQKYH